MGYDTETEMERGTDLAMGLGLARDSDRAMVKDLEMGWG
jgi:hypothetical protein